MDALIANYESDSDSESNSTKNRTVDEAAPKTNINFLSSADLNSSEEEERHEDDDSYKCAVQYLEEKCRKSVDSNTDSEKIPLPSPALETKMKSTITNSHLQNSVFVNHFQKAEDAKLLVLEKHVKVTTIEKKNEIGGKKICWNYRKGKCRKGHRCQFAHDNDIPLHVEQPIDSSNTDDKLCKETETTSQLPYKTFKQQSHFGEGYYNQFEDHGAKEVSSDLVDDDNYMASLKRKKKHGIKDSLVPPKKALNDLQKQQAEERPWTVNQ